MQKAVRNEKIEKYSLIKWSQCQWLQPKKFKSRLKSDIKKLKKSLLENDFIMPFFVSEKLEPGIIFILDGHGRKQALEELATEGHAIPEELPALFLDVHSKDEAFKTLLLFNSSYGVINKSELQNILSQINIKTDDLLKQVQLTNILDDIVTDSGDDLKEENLPGGKANILLTFGIFKLGMYKFKVNRSVYDDWINDIRKKTGLNEDDIIQEFKERLKIKD